MASKVSEKSSKDQKKCYNLTPARTLTQQHRSPRKAKLETPTNTVQVCNRGEKKMREQGGGRERRQPGMKVWRQGRCGMEAPRRERRREAQVPGSRAGRQTETATGSGLGSMDESFGLILPSLDLDA
uniref:Uncharacterized protein n=1 Tax=Oryza meridionalis TaxID=40149 RepID=A0A0E0F539_9ORYZ